MSDTRIKRLERKHRSLLRDFRNSERSLVTYLQRFALRHEEKDLLARTMLAIHTNDAGEERLVGYFSLTTVAVVRAPLNDVEGLSKLPRFPIPGILLARLAVDERLRGQGYGRLLFQEVLARTLHLAESGPVRFRLLVTDALNEPAVGFYERFGTVRISDDFPARMVLDLKPILAPRQPS